MAGGILSEEFFDEVGAPHAFELVHNALAFLLFVPEEELTLGQFVSLCFCGEYGLECIGMVACVPGFGGYGHGSGGEVLYLFQMEVKLFGDDCQFCHVLCRAAWVTADEDRKSVV